MNSCLCCHCSISSRLRMIVRAMLVDAASANRAQTDQIRADGGCACSPLTSDNTLRQTAAFAILIGALAATWEVSSARARVH
jgi:hypothetical protein